jgi:hypothetical protein
LTRCEETSGEEPLTGGQGEGNIVHESRNRGGELNGQG